MNYWICLGNELHQTHGLSNLLDGSRSSRDTQRVVNAVSGRAVRTDHSSVQRISIQPPG